MLSLQEKAEIRSAMGALKARIPGFKARRPQLAMVATVAHALAQCRREGDPQVDGRNIAVIEAGTGTGKSFGALAPALVMARSRGMRLVVSSSTIALQQQYVDKDAPTLAAALPSGFTCALAKGRRRYACPLKMASAARRIRTAEASRRGPAAGGPTQQARAMVLRLHAEFEARRWSGDQDDLRDTVPGRVWDAVTIEAQGCSGSLCEKHAVCPYYEAKRKVDAADVIVANHDLVLASLRTEGGSLPDPAQTFYVFDEAHSMASKVVEHAGRRHGLLATRAWLSELAAVVRESCAAFGIREAIADRLDEDVVEVLAGVEELATRLETLKAWEEKAVHRFDPRQRPAWLEAAGQKVHAAARSISGTMAALREELASRGEGAALADLGGYAAKVDQVTEAWGLFLTRTPIDRPPTARWVERARTGEATSEWTMCASPIEGNDALRSMLWERAAGVVLMSATLASCGSLEFFLRQTGLGGYGSLHTLIVDSPFDYRSKAKLVVCDMATSPVDASRHTTEVIERLPLLIDTRGTLVLFTSHQQMREVHAALPRGLHADTMVQGDMPKAAMLRRHKARIDAGERSIIFGLQSMAEGVDLPGDYCTHVIAAKLPFSVPDNPIEETRREWLESLGRSSFHEVTLPETSRRLTQQAGRLLRTVTDEGRFTVLDRRLVTKRWGARLLQGLPPFLLVDERQSRSR